ncbi:hypothetical protein E4U58_001732, partial [Claviceps cyperi]
VHNAGNGIVSVGKNQELGRSRFRSMSPDARVYTVDVAAQPAASDLALVTKDLDEKHLLLSGQIENLLREYSQVFVDKGFARVPEEEQMRIEMKPGWQDMVLKKCRV